MTWVTQQSVHIGKVVLRHIRHAGLMVVVAAWQVSGAQAQTVDYGSLEALFDEPVTTSATGKPQKASEAPVALEIITANEIRRMGVTSLPEVLNRVPGLTSWQATRSFADVGVRGQNTSYNPTLLVLVNGRQVYIDVYGYTDWALIPVQMEEIRQIEVVKGPTTALYGFNAVSGVVNIVTYNPKYDPVDQAGVTGGTGNYGRAYGYKSFKLSDRADIRLSGSKETFDEFDLKSATTYAQNGTFQDADTGKLLADGLFQLADKTQLRLEGAYADAKGTDSVVGFRATPADKNLWSVKASLTSETSIGLVEANLYTNQFEVTYQGGTPGTAENQITVAQLQDLFKVGADHTFRLQGEYRHNAMQSDVFIGPGAEVSYDVVAAGGMWNWAIAPTVEWTNALRVDHLMLGRSGPLPSPDPFSSNSEFDQDFTAYSVNSGLVWKATDRDTLRASYGRGIQAPSIAQFGLDLPVAAGVVAAGDPNLQPVIVQNYEVGYDRLLSGINGKFRSSLFYKKTEGINDLSGASFVSGASLISGVARVGNSNTAGLELGLAGKIGAPWDWDISYIYQTTDDDLIPFATPPSSVSTHYENTVPHHVVKGHLGYASGPWEADAYGEVGSSFDAVTTTAPFIYGVTRLDGYHTLGARVGYTFENDITLAVFGSDLTQGSVANNYGLENERRVFVSISKKF